MSQGKVKWFNNAKGYGFIIADEDNSELANEDLFAHFSAIKMDGYRTLKAGQRVTFEAEPSGKGFHAVDIVAIDEQGNPITMNPAHGEKSEEAAITDSTASQPSISSGAADSEISSSSDEPGNSDIADHSSPKAVGAAR